MSTTRFPEIDVEKTLIELREAASRAANEEEFKINAERILYNNVLSKLGIEPGRYEYTFVSGGRADALYGHLIIEYKAPGKLNRDSDIAKAKEQLIGYITKEAGSIEERYKSFIGVILCDKIAFVRYNPKEKKWLLRGPYELNREALIRLIEAIRGLRRKRLVVGELLRDFGPGSSITKKAIKAFYSKVVNSKKPKVIALFTDWKRLFSQVCAYSPEKLRGLEKNYGLTGEVDYSALLFSIHTYYAFLMKLLAAEIAYLYGAGKFLKSYIAELEDAYMRSLESFKEVLEEIESGGIFREYLRIINFVEGDYFSWYLEELDQELATILCEVAKKLADYEPTTPILEPEYAKDLLKRLYQNLVPRDIRHKLGEYYTPDWLAELVLDEVGYTVEDMEKLASEKDDILAPLNLRVLDPACGSGTFLILAIKRLREYSERHFLNDILINYVLRNIVGFDLNPLAVLAARTNYLLVIADLLSYAKGLIEIPIYLADSLLVEARPTLQGTMYVLRTSVGEFTLPKSIVDKGLLGELLSYIDRCIRGRYSPTEFISLIEKALNISNEEAISTIELFETFMKLEKEGKNHIWTSIIRNAFAPLLMGEFDFVVGNPPWINWENLPAQYRELTKKLWDIYGLLERTKGMGLGKVKRDIAMLFIARCLDLYTKDKGKFAFLAPYTLYKTQAGAGFRKFLSYRCKVVKIHDLVTLYPFEAATNRTSLIIIEKDKLTEFPIPCVMWYNPRTKGIEQDLELNEVRKITKQFNMVLIPVEKNNPMSPWMEITEKAYEGIKKVIGESPWYKAYEGVNTALNQVYWIQILQETPDGLLINNPPLPGQKKSVKQVKQVVERELVYPLVRGRDVKKWYICSDIGYILLPVNKNGETLLHSDLRINYPMTWKYMINFVDNLVNRGGEPYKSKLKPYRERSFEIAEKIAPPFYWLFNVKPSLAHYKVVWKRIAGAITGKAISFASAVLEPIRLKYFNVEKPIILNDSLILIPLNTADEAYYISGILNSNIVLLAIASYTYELRQETHITQYIKIPKFNRENDLHVEISKLSKRAHEIAKKIYEEGREDLKEDLRRIEGKIDKMVARLYGITDEELFEIRKCLKILKEGEIEREEVEEKIPKVIPDIGIGNPVVNEDEPFNLDVVIRNFAEKPITNVKVKVEILDKKFEKLINEVSDEYVWSILMDGLKSGKYKVKLLMEYLLEGELASIEKEVPLYVKSSSEKVVRRGGIEDFF